MVVNERQQGTVMLELLLCITLVMLFALQALPAMYKFYRQLAVEYEAEHLLADIRHCQSLSRLIAEPAWGYGAKDLKRKYATLEFFPGGNQLTTGGSKVIGRNTYLPGVLVKKLNANNKICDETVKIGFKANGRPKFTEGMITVLIYFAGYEQEGRRIMVSKGGRIRMERGGVATLP